MHETGIHQFPEKPEDKSPFVYAHNMSMWEYFQKNQDQRKYFDDYMAVRRLGLSTWHENFPFARELGPGAKRGPDAVLLVDVGGNWGHEVASFHEAHPNIPGRLILQDLPSMIETVRSRPPKDIELMSYDFFTEQPVKGKDTTVRHSLNGVDICCGSGARAYYFRNICHDWSDKHCETFLTMTAQAMEKGYSRLLIDDYVLPDVGAPIRGSAMDFLMMMFCSGIERTKRQWGSLLDRCGLEIVQIWGGRSDYEQVIEAQLKC